MHTPPKQTRAASYQTTMDEMRVELPPAARAASRFIHAPIVTGIFTTVGVLLSPRSLLIGGVFACFALVGSYVFEQLFGAQPSSLIILGSFGLGWISGLVYDLVDYRVRRD